MKKNNGKIIIKSPFLLLRIVNSKYMVFITVIELWEKLYNNILTYSWKINIIRVPTFYTQFFNNVTKFSTALFNYKKLKKNIETSYMRFKQ